MKAYRLVWDERVKPRCKCCDANEGTHAWSHHGNEIVYDLKEAERQQDKMFTQASEATRNLDFTREYRNIHIEVADMTEWKPLNAWEAT